MSTDAEYNFPVVDVSNQSVAVWSKPDPDAPTTDRIDPDCPSGDRFDPDANADLMGTSLYSSHPESSDRTGHIHGGGNGDDSA